MSEPRFLRDRGQTGLTSDYSEYAEQLMAVLQFTVTVSRPKMNLYLH